MSFISEPAKPTVFTAENAVLLFELYFNWFGPIGELGSQLCL